MPHVRCIADSQIGPRWYGDDGRGAAFLLPGQTLEGPIISRGARQANGAYRTAHGLSGYATSFSRENVVDAEPASWDAIVAANAERITRAFDAEYRSGPTFEGSPCASVIPETVVPAARALIASTGWPQQEVTTETDSWRISYRIATGHSLYMTFERDGAHHTVYFWVGFR